MVKSFLLTAISILQTLTAGLFVFPLGFNANIRNAARKKPEKGGMLVIWVFEIFLELIKGISVVSQPFLNGGYRKLNYAGEFL